MQTHNMERLARLMTYMIFVYAILGLMKLMFQPRDATDPISGARSGMELHTDAGTGCQYLSVPGGGITPRLGFGGVHEGCHQ